jgi:hypothetical protein
MFGEYVMTRNENERGERERDEESGYPSSQILWAMLEYQAFPVRKPGFGWGLCRLVVSWNL